MDLNNLITAGALALIGFGMISVAGLIKRNEDYEGGEGEQIIPPGPDEKPPPDYRDPCNTKATKQLGCPCKGTSECSSTGIEGGRSANIFDRVSCDRGRCEYKRQDWAGVWYPPSECVGEFLGRPETCKKSYEEQQLRERMGW